MYVRNIRRCYTSLYMYCAEYIHARNICMLEIYACQKYMHIGNIHMPQIYAFVFRNI